MRIALVTTSPIVNVCGGVERIFTDMAEALLERGHTVTAVYWDRQAGTLLFPPGAGVRVVNCARLHGLRERFLDCLCTPFMSKLRYCYKLSRLERLQRRERVRCQRIAYALAGTLDDTAFDVILSFQHTTTFIVLDLLHLTVPVISLLHGIPSVYFESDNLPLYRSALNRCACVQVLLPEFEAILRRYITPQRVCSIPNRVFAVTEQAALTHPVIVHVGRISREKQQHLLIDAFAQIQADCPDWSVQFWGTTDGDPRYFTELTERIRRLGLGDRVQLCGPTEHVTQRLLDSAIFCFPSEQEGFPLALTEAMACGLPVIGLRCCQAVAHLIEDGVSGFLCGTSVDELAEKLRLLIGDERLRRQMGARARASMQAYAPPKVWAQWDALVRELGRPANEKSAEPRQCPPQTGPL